VVVLAARSPSHCFETAFEACRIAVEHMTPVILLSEGGIATSHEPWRLPDPERLPALRANHPTVDPGLPFRPYARDPGTLARPWALPGLLGLEHRLGGLAKFDGSGNVSYDPENHDKMIRLRAEKVARVADRIPPVEVWGPPSGPLLVLGWGATYGAIRQAVLDLGKGPRQISQVHLTHLNPFPKNLGEIVKKFRTVLVPETNSGQLLMLLRNKFPGTNFVGYNRVRGVPFSVSELREEISSRRDHAA
jgi:2-oxoglutarate ferredoxin oxidoreductase subunit alpha